MHGNPTKMHVHERNNIPCGSMVLRNKKCDRTKATGCNFWYGSLNSRFISSFTFDSPLFVFHYLLTICEILICFSISCYPRSIQYDSVFKGFLLLLLHFWFSATRLSFHWSLASQSVENLSKLHLSHFFSSWSLHSTFSHVHPLLCFPQILSQPTFR